jgi:hypothetical protein
VSDGGTGQERPPAEVVYLDVEDEITSAAARLRRTASERVAFVLPYGSRLATSRINFRLLAREAAARNRQLEIVAGDASARALAGSAGLVVHASVAELEAGPAAGGPEGLPGTDRPTAPDAGRIAADLAPGGPAAAAPSAARGAPAFDGTETRVLAVPAAAADRIPVVGRRRPIVPTRAAVAVVVVLALLLVGGGYLAVSYLPSATIVLHQASEQIGPLQLVVEARSDVTAADAETLTVPARTFSFDAAASQLFTTTGKTVTATKATGSVTFQNCDTGGNLSIPADSRVSTADNVGFRTLARVTIKRASVFPFACKTGSVAVVAEEAGTAGNVAAGQINRVPPGYDRIVLSVTNTQPTSGGTHEETPIVTQDDIDAAMATLDAALRDDFEQQITDGSGVPAGTTLFDETKVLGSATPSVDPQTLIGQAVAQFDLGLSATGTVLGVDPAPVQAVAAARLQARVEDGWQLADGSTHIDVGTPVVDGDVVDFPVQATATRIRLIDRDALLSQVRGLVLAEARSRLEAYGTVEVSLWPDWVTTIPTDAGRISLSIVPAAGASPAPSAP